MDLKKIFLLAAAMILAAGCYNYEEHLYLYEDLSGRLDASVSSTDLDDDDYDKLKAGLENLEGGRLINFDVDDEDEMTRIDFSLKFKHVTDLNALWEDRTLVPAGIFEIKETDGLFHMKRSVPPTEDGEKEPDVETVEYLESFTWKYTLHLPGQIISVNTDDEDDDGNPVWEFTLLDHSRDEMNMNAEWSASDDSARTFFLIFFIVLLVLIWRRLMRRKSGAGEKK